MARVKLGDVAREYKETCKGSKTGLRAVGLEHLESENIALTQWEPSSNNTFSKLFYEGQMLFGRRRAYLKKAALAPFDGICSGDIIVIEANRERLLPTLMPFIIQSNAFFDFAVEGSAGSLSPRVKWEHLRQYEFNLPSLEEQAKLAEVLWAFEKTRASYKTLLASTEELVQAQFIEMFGDPVANPYRLPKFKLSKRCKIITGNTPSRSNQEYYGDFIEWIKSDNMDTSSGVLLPALESLSEEGFKKCRAVDRGCILMTCIAGSAKCIGSIAIADRKVAFNQQINAIVPTTDNVNYLYWLLKLSQNYIRYNASKTLKAILTKGQLSEMQFPFAPIQQQSQFSMFAQAINSSKSAIQQSLSTLNQARNTLIEKTFR